MNKKFQKVIFYMSIDGGEIGIKCTYLKSKKIKLNNYTRSFYKHSKKEIIRSKKNVCVCSTLKQHARDLKDDPERLSTEFMQKMIGVECK